MISIPHFPQRTVRTLSRGWKRESSSTRAGELAAAATAAREKIRKQPVVKTCSVESSATARVRVDLQNGLCVPVVTVKKRTADYSLRYIRDAAK